MIVVKIMDEQLHSKSFIEAQKKNVDMLRSKYGIAAIYKDLIFGKLKNGRYESVLIIELPDNTKKDILDNFDLIQFDTLLAAKPSYFDNDIIATYSDLEEEDLKNVIYGR